jgi:hypothetical protein
MKAIRMNNVKPLTFLLRERLSDRSERRQLNILINAIASGLEKARSNRLKPTVKMVGAIGGHVAKVQPDRKPSGGISPEEKTNTVSIKEAVKSSKTSPTVAGRTLQLMETRPSEKSEQAVILPVPK